MKLTIKAPANAKIKHTEHGIEVVFDDKAAQKYIEVKITNTVKNVITDDKRITVTKNQKLTM